MSGIQYCSAAKLVEVAGQELPIKFLEVLQLNSVSEQFWKETI